MVEKFTGFRATSGRTFDNERDAWIDELETKLAPIVENEAITRKLATAIGDNPHDIADVLAHIVMMSPVATVPTVQVEPAPSAWPERDLRQPIAATRYEV